MTVASRLQQGFNSLLSKASKSCKFRYYTYSHGSVWDDELTLTQSGADVWISGIVLPISRIEGTSDFLLLEQGKLANDDQRLFVSGGVAFGGSQLDLKIQMGSPNGDQFRVVPIGLINAEVSDTSIFKKAYVRRLTNGSLIGE